MNAAVAYAVAAGLCVAVIGPLNAGLQSRFGLWGMNAWVHLIGLAFCLVVLLTTRASLAAAEAGPPWYSYFGGVVGSMIVVFTVLAIARLGVSGTLVLTIGSQLLLAAAIDRFGLLGQARSSLSTLQVIGLMLVFLGATLVVARPAGSPAAKSRAEVPASAAPGRVESQELRSGG